MLKLLNSRRFAIALLLAMLLVLILSTFLPSHFTLPAARWDALEKEKPVVFWLASRFATPFLVRSPFFIALSIFLFLSTLVCTVTRVRKWLVQKETEFMKERAFSFSVDVESAHDIQTLKSAAGLHLSGKGWKYSIAEQGRDISIQAQKGIGLGFWGSVVFHSGLILCFFAAPVTALTLFRGTVIMTDGATAPLRQGFETYEGNDPSSLPPVNVSVSDLRGVYEKGIYKVDFGGKMRITGDSETREYQFRVNESVDFRGYQFTLHEFGFSPRVIISEGGRSAFDYFLNLRNPDEGDYFEIGGGKNILILLFPEFFREGERIGSRSKEPKNPVMLIKLFEGGREIHSGLLKKGETLALGPYVIDFPDLRNWANFIVVRDPGIQVLFAGFLIGTAGLLARFLSNERRFEMELVPGPSGTLLRMNGYSRYYPAFLENEVRRMSAEIEGGG